MDFFESQELARKKTKWLILLFVIAVVLIIVTIQLLITGVFAFTSGGQDVWQAMDWRILAVVAAGVILIVSSGSFYKLMELSGGGSTVASLMGGRRIQGNTSKLVERKVMNVVEEMALASGVPVPPVYILDDEESINAFAAGYTIDDAVIGINRGTAEQLSRNELQGVVAHEFSHILNGDMRMSLRMVGILHGILLISLIGWAIIRSLGSGRRSSRNRDKEGGAIAAILAVGFGLYVIGSIGLFFGRLIKASMSQQREYLADASAVQFTRYPRGISDALKTIGGSAGGSTIERADAEQISHMFFATSRMSSWLSTHPPLVPRIQRIEPTFDGNFSSFMIERKRQRDLRIAERKKNTADAFSMIPGQAGPFPINPVILIAAIGIPTDDDVIYSHELVAEIPEILLAAARDTYSARCLVFAWLLDSDPRIQRTQLEKIHRDEVRGTLEATLKLKPLVDRLPTHLRLPVFEIVQGSLSGMSDNQYPGFRNTALLLIHADRKVDLFEFFLQRHLIVHLDRCFNGKLPNRIKFTKLESLKPDVIRMISILAKVGHPEPQEQRDVFLSSIRSLYPDVTAALFETDWNADALSRSLKRVSQATPMIKKQILTIGVHAIMRDQVLTVEEIEMFRAMSEAIDCPVPPLAPTRREIVEFASEDDLDVPDDPA